MKTNESRTKRPTRLPNEHSLPFSNCPQFRPACDFRTFFNSLLELFGTSEATAFFRKAINHCEELTSDERGRFFAVLGSLISAYDNIYNQYANGRLREDIYISIATNYYGIVNMPCAQQTMTQDYKLLPPYLRDASVVDLLADHVDDMEPPTFLTE